MVPLDPTAIVGEISEGLRRTAGEVVPWFLAQMPSAYFQDTDHDARLAHLRAIIAGRASGLPLSMTLRSESGSIWTFIGEGSSPGLLARLLHQLPTDRPLRSAKVHSTADGSLVLDVFEFGERAPFDPEVPEQYVRRAALLEHARQFPHELPAGDVDGHLSASTADYVLTVSPLRFGRNLKLFRAVSGTDGTVVAIEQERDPKLSRIVLAVGNATPRLLFERCAATLGAKGIDIQQAYLDVFDDPGNGKVSLLTFLVHGPDGAAIDPRSALWTEMRRSLQRVKWLDDLVLRLAERHPELGLLRAEVLLGLSRLVHQGLSREDPFAFSRDRIVEILERNLADACAVCDLFLSRFDPNAALPPEPAFAAGVERVRTSIERGVDAEDARRVLEAMVGAAVATLRTNVHVEERYALAIRFDPGLLHHETREEVPYGAFFVHGGSFDGFHVRFRDIARGGLRVVRPLGLDQHALEADRLYDEAYGLAFAQQLKNKDIPEGGAKAVVLTSPDASLPRCVKAFTDALLDVITPDPVTRGRVVDRFGREEILYLGPDENITPELIEWIVARARRRGVPSPNAFMSSKPGAGINHKTYGVTSEGITVFLEVALRSAGIDPRRRPFTVKITGGPDGDVAGNQIKILCREFGSHPRIVGIADRSGCAEDPGGLDHVELLRLVTASLPVGAFDPQRLGPGGRLVLVEAQGGLKLRNTMHNRVLSDAFIPAGGRPQTVHAGNWRDFLDEAGAPSSRVIVEGANLFFTPEARTHLSERGAVIVKDSSANKCGVICSSFEVAASMLLSEEEFLGVKDRFVQEVLARLRSFARLEAELLFREHARRPDVALPDLSTRLSKIISRASDAVAERVSKLPASEPMAAVADALVLRHLPRVLIEVAGSRISERLPRAYMTRTIASTLAALIVYREGLDYLEPLAPAALGDLALEYLRREQETARLVEAVSASALADRERIARIVERAGTRAALDDAAREPTDAEAASWSGGERPGAKDTGGRPEGACENGARGGREPHALD